MNGRSMVEEWARAYQPARARWAVIVWEAAGLAYLHWTTARLFGLGADLSVALAVVFALVWVVGSWQVLRMGVYVSEHAVRVRGVVRTRTIPWAEIDGVAVDDVVQRVGPLRVPAGRTVVLALRGGGQVDTAMWERGLDFHHRPQLFRDVCRELRDRVPAAHSRT
ncbi:PH domain-containing protein [Actinoplanes sp. NPDC020271]|uniref:PH domain-containing protein n=1 Tax=Actinoplanes sp. NPDC020271 TaxID=3363896 RepID=UPI003787E6B5